MSRRRIPWLRVAITGILVALLAPPALYLLALHVRPPITAQGHHVMPLAQVGFAVLFGGVLSVVAATLVGLVGRK